MGEKFATEFRPNMIGQVVSVGVISESHDYTAIIVGRLQWYCVKTDRTEFWLEGNAKLNFVTSPTGGRLEIEVHEFL